MNQQAKSYDPTTLGSPSDDEPGTLRDEEGNVLPTFDPKHAEPFKGLLYLGALSDSFEWLGHTFDIRTLRDGEKLAVASIIKPYVETMGADRAYADAMVAMCITGVDGDDLPIPIGETKRAHEWGHQRFQYVKDNWFSSTVDVVFNRYLMLEDLATKVLVAMGKASAPEDSIPSSSTI
jgi:hypothetical protein